MMLLQQSLFDLEPLLLARLTAQFAKPQTGSQAVVKVLTAADLEGVNENMQFTPAVHLVSLGYNVAQNTNDGTEARITQEWLAVVATRSQSGLRAGDAARAEAGVIAAQVCAALMGYKPSLASKPMRLANAPGAKYSAGFQYLPLAFEIELTLQPIKE